MVTVSSGFPACLFIFEGEFPSLSCELEQRYPRRHRGTDLKRVTKKENRNEPNFIKYYSRHEHLHNSTSKIVLRLHATKLLPTKEYSSCAIKSLQTTPQLKDKIFKNTYFRTVQLLNSFIGPRLGTSDESSQNSKCLLTKTKT